MELALKSCSFMMPRAEIPTQSVRRSRAAAVMNSSHGCLWLLLFYPVIYGEASDSVYLSSSPLSAASQLTYSASVHWVSCEDAVSGFLFFYFVLCWLPFSIILKLPLRNSSVKLKTEQAAHTLGVSLFGSDVTSCLDWIFPVHEPNTFQIRPTLQLEAQKHIYLLICDN